MSRTFRPRLPARAVFAGLLAWASTAFAQEPASIAPAADEPPARARVSANGFDAFRGLAKRAGLRPLAGTRDLMADPKHTILIVLGGDGPASPEWLHAYLNAGGVVLFATDQPLGNQLRWYWSLGFTINGDHVRTRAPSHYYRLADCPVVWPLNDRTPIFGGLDRVATNLPSYISNFRSDADVLALFPQSCEVANSRMIVPAGESLPFALTRRVGDGRLLVLADHSVFINVMMMGENDNFTMTERLLDWLSGPEKRAGCLLDQEGQIQTSFDVKWLAGPPPSLAEIGDMLKDNWRAAIPLLNAVAREAQKKGGPLDDLQGRDALMNRWLRALLPNRVLGPALAILASAVLILLGLSRATAARQRTDSEVAAFSAKPGLEADQTPLRRRLAAQAERGDWYEVAREQVRERFQALGLLDTATDRPPVVAAPDAGWWRRRQLRRRIHGLWQIGFGPEPLAVSAARWRELLARLDALERAAVQGTWRFEPTREDA